mmetsp:Transcript_2575/g.5728  ORF Transcript_2575/g.5728 Transcript_2575/m.5728 type:complete len:362 (-) Transcript_2575:443-1528(-)
MLRPAAAAVVLASFLPVCCGQDTKPHGVSAMAMPIVIVVIFLLFFSVVRELLRCAWHRRVFHKLEEIKRGQEDFVSAGAQVENPMQRLTNGRWSVLWLDGRQERVSRLTLELTPERDLEEGEVATSVGLVRGHGLDSLGDCTIDGRWCAGKDRVAWTQTYRYSHHRSGVVVEAWGNVVLEAEGRVHVRGQLRSSEGNGRSGYFVMRPVALDQVMVLLQEIAPQLMIGALGVGDRRVESQMPQRVVRREPVELEQLEEGKGSEDTCLICLDECEQAACRLECGHVFHTACIQQWLANHDECVTCKHVVRRQPPEPEAAAASHRPAAMEMQPAQLRSPMEIAQASDVMLFAQAFDRHLRIQRA